MNELVYRSVEGGVVLVFVLEPANIKLLEEGKPIVKYIESYFPDGIPNKLELVIHYSKTPIRDSKEFAAMSKMTFDERTPVLKRIQPHCPECKSTIEQLAVWRNESLMALTFCSVCGCLFGMLPSEMAKSLNEGLKKKEMGL